MTRSRWLIVILALLAILSLFVFGGRDWRSALFSGLLSSRLPAAPFHEASFDQLPRWASSLGSLLALSIFGSVLLYLVPARVRNMSKALTISWSRFLQVILAGLAFGLLFALAALLASLARVTFPLTLLTGLTLFALSLWGYLALAYALGHALLQRARWALSPLLALVLGLVLLHALIHLPFLGMLFGLLYVGAGLGIVVTTRFGSMQSWDLNLLLEETNE